MKQQRITLVARDPRKPDSDWNYMRGAGTRGVFIDSVAVVKFAIASTDLDIERIILDRTGGAEEFLNLLTMVPAHFGGDILMIADKGDGFMSASGRGGDRVVYALKVEDIRFYLETHDLVTGRAALKRVA